MSDAHHTARVVFGAAQLAAAIFGAAWAIEISQHQSWGMLLRRPRFWSALVLFAGMYVGAFATIFIGSTAP